MVSSGSVITDPTHPCELKRKLNLVKRGQEPPQPWQMTPKINTSIPSQQPSQHQVTSRPQGKEPYPIWALNFQHQHLFTRMRPQCQNRWLIWQIYRCLSLRNKNSKLLRWDGTMTGSTIGILMMWKRKRKPHPNKTKRRITGLHLLPKINSITNLPQISGPHLSHNRNQNLSQQLVSGLLPNRQLPSLRILLQSSQNLTNGHLLQRTHLNLPIRLKPQMTGVMHGAMMSQLQSTPRESTTTNWIWINWVTTNSVDTKLPWTKNIKRILWRRVILALSTIKKWTFQKTRIKQLMRLGTKTSTVKINIVMIFEKVK